MKVIRYMVIGLLFVILLVTFVDRGLLDNYRMKEHLIAIKRANSNITKENVDLRNRISLLRSDLSYIEIVARNELGMVKKGDLVMQFEK